MNLSLTTLYQTSTSIDIGLENAILLEEVQKSPNHAKNKKVGLMPFQWKLLEMPQ